MNFHILTPDAQYADDAVVERRAAGDLFRFDIHRQREAAAIPEDSLAACDGVLLWHAFRCTLMPQRQAHM